MDERFCPTHKHQTVQQEVESLGEVIIMSAPLEGLMGILYRDRDGTRYVKQVDDFLEHYKPLRDQIEEAAKSLK